MPKVSEIDLGSALLSIFILAGFIATGFVILRLTIIGINYVKVNFSKEQREGKGKNINKSETNGF